MHQKRVHMLGVPIAAITRAQAIDSFVQMLTEPRFHHVMTPNAEMLVEASRNESFHNLLQRTDLNLPDSQGLVWMARLTGQHLPERVTGVDTVMDLCMKLTAEHPVFLLGAAPGIAEKAALELKRRNSNLAIAGTWSGSPVDAEAPTILEKIDESGAHILLVAFGAPAQDLWIDRHRSQLPSIRMAMGVGGTFDFLAGKVKRAPLIFRTLGLEWLWRLIIEPRRIGRIWTAVVVFPWFVLRSRKSK